MEQILSNKKLLKLPFLALIIILPFGQLMSFQFEYDDFRINLLVLDLLMAFIATWAVWFAITRKHYLNYLKFILIFSGYVLFIQILNSAMGLGFSIISCLYAVRLIIYLLGAIYFAILVDTHAKIKWLEWLVVGLLAASILGIVQYLYLPDLRILKVFGWDDHLGRLVGGYSDPGFMSTIAVLGAILSLYKAFQKNLGEYYFVFSIFVMTLLLTYSRAGYLGLVVGLMYLGYALQKWTLVLFILLLFVCSIFLLPRGKGVGVKLERTHSIVERLENYKESLILISNKPLFGVGYNNLCLARLNKKNAQTNILENNEQGVVSPKSHACFGADNSFLFIVSTLGIAGILFLMGISKNLLKEMRLSTIFTASILSVGVISLFINALVYPFSLALLIVICSCSKKSFTR